MCNNCKNCDEFDNRIGCDFCVIPNNYKTARFSMKNNKKICNYCDNFKQQKFKGIEQMKADINLHEGEKIGVMVSGGKDGLFAWQLLCEIFGSDNVIAFNHNKLNLVHPIAEKNMYEASRILKSQLVMINDSSFFERFKKNMEILLTNPDPSMVRVVLCSGCRFGITGKLYDIASKKYNIRKFVSAASYLELAPFKEELLRIKGNGNSTYGLIKGLAENEEYNYDDNIQIILRDDNLTYKKMDGDKKSISALFDKYELFDLDSYIENNPFHYESVVSKKLNWKHPGKSWHFDCLVEEFKDFFYFSQLGYTEVDFKVSQMIRYNLITRDEGIEIINKYHRKMKNCMPDLLKLLDQLNLSHLKEGFINIYENSIFFKKI